MASSLIMGICSLSLFKNRCIGARWNSENLRPVLSPLLHSKSFCGFHITRDGQKESLWWLPKPYVVWPWTPVLTASTSFFPSHTKPLLVFKLTELISVSGPGTFHLLYLNCSSLNMCMAPFPASWGSHLQIFPIPFDLPGHRRWKLQLPASLSSISCFHGQVVNSLFFLCSHPI